MSDQTTEQRGEASARELLKCISTIPPEEIDAMEPKMVMFWLRDIMMTMTDEPIRPVGQSFLDRARQFEAEMDIDYSKGAE